MSDLVVASNRGPVTFSIGADGELAERQGGGGLASGLASALEGRDATWVAASSTAGDAVAAAAGDRRVGSIRLRLLDIPAEIQQPAYDVIANGTLWFLQHDLFERPRRPLIDRHWHEAWDRYRDYNRVFAETIADVAPDGATVLVHDYHLSLCGSDLARLRPDLSTAHFTHTPWCGPDDLSVLPTAVVAELLSAMCGYGSCGFHTSRWAAAFRRCAEELAGLEPQVFVSPIASDSERLRAMAASTDCRQRRAALDERIGDRRLLLRSERVELSKNLLRGFRAFGELLEDRPEWRERVVFLARTYPSRERLPEYIAYRAEVERLVEMLNDRFATPDWTPIELEVEDDYASTLAALTRYDVLLVNPIRDGLNLVAKEGPIVNSVDGVLALSTGAGAHDELDGALEVHPYDVSQTAAALARALDMDPDERADRAARLRRTATAATPASWLADLEAAAGPARETRRP